jgi:hypothetical protein
MPSKGLATSGTRWGLSCTVADEASMGVILGHMKLFGADDIGFEPLGPAVKRHKNPANVKAGKAGGRPKGIANHSRKPLIEASSVFLKKVKAGEEFTVKAFNKHMLKEGWGEPSAYRAINEEIAAGTIKRVSKGKYQRTSRQIAQEVA